jgi:hypothetical protein
MVTGAVFVGGVIGVEEKDFGVSIIVTSLVIKLFEGGDGVVALKLLLAGIFLDIEEYHVVEVVGGRPLKTLQEGGVRVGDVVEEGEDVSGLLNAVIFAVLEVFSEFHEVVEGVSISEEEFIVFIRGLIPGGDIGMVAIVNAGVEDTAGDSPLKIFDFFGTVTNGVDINHFERDEGEGPSGDIKIRAAFDGYVDDTITGGDVSPGMYIIPSIYPVGVFPRLELAGGSDLVFNLIDEGVVGLSVEVGDGDGKGGRFGDEYLSVDKGVSEDGVEVRGLVGGEGDEGKEILVGGFMSVEAVDDLYVGVYVPVKAP